MKVKLSDIKITSAGRPRFSFVDDTGMTYVTYRFYLPGVTEAFLEFRTVAGAKAKYPLKGPFSLDEVVLENLRPYSVTEASASTPTKLKPPAVEDLPENGGVKSRKKKAVVNG